MSYPSEPVDVGIPGEWQPILPEDVLEGELFDFGENRWRLTDVPGKGPAIDIQASFKGHRSRLRLHVVFDPLPFHGRVITEPSIFGSGAQRRWYETVDGETHLVIETMADPADIEKPPAKAST